jgi:hypothetical protein
MISCKSARLWSSRGEQKSKGATESGIKAVFGVGVKYTGTALAGSIVGAELVTSKVFGWTESSGSGVCGVSNLTGSISRVLSSAPDAGDNNPRELHPVNKKRYSTNTNNGMAVLERYAFVLRMEENPNTLYLSHLFRPFLEIRLTIALYPPAMILGTRKHSLNAHPCS